MNFEVGERVQFVAESELKIGKITKVLWGELEIDTGDKCHYKKVLEVAKLDKPKPIVVPKFVAEWIEESGATNLSKKDAIHWTLKFLFIELKGVYPAEELMREPVLEWLDEDRNNYFKLVDAVRYGYVVEEEPKWIVSFTDSDREHDTFYFAGFSGSKDEPFDLLVAPWKSSSYKFTEKEKADAVAVLISGTVEEVEAE
ncbi:DUF1642 domain-containing protein [Listeria monocytogenes]|nr:DUF1642 domain-containing protein [Listeria monocytogenes]